VSETGGELGVIELRVETISQLFDTLDPFPFPQRDLDSAAEEFIVGWAREFPRHQSLTVRIHLPREETHAREALALPEAFFRYFTYRAESLGRDLNELFRIGRLALLVGLSALSICLVLSQFLIGMFGENTLVMIVAESLIIVGWVANWKPIEIFLYEWWPIARRCRLYRRLAEAKVELVPE
jgi:hypothetical protein